jgi:alpha-glucosidase (family GH31 glycosyl hydrolase)
MGDNEPSFLDLRESIAMMALSAMSGPYWTGCDVGGHLANTTEELLTRWFQLGAWTYTYFREHNTIESAHREPYLYHGDTYKRLAKAMNDRYSLIAVWYTSTVGARWTGRGPVVPLWYEWPEVPEFHKNEIICLLGDALLVAPVTQHEQTQVEVLKPPGVWYDFWSGRELKQSQNVSVTMNDIPVFIRGGRIVPWYANPINTTVATIVTPLTLYIAENENGTASGTFYLDDGTTFNASVNNIFVHRHIRYENKEVRWTKSQFPIEESGVPDVLKNAIVESFVFYNRQGVNRVTGLSLPICDVWVWRKGDSGVYRDESEIDSKLKSSLIAVLGVGIGILVVGVGFVVARKLKSRNAEVDSVPLIKSG